MNPFCGSGWSGVKRCVLAWLWVCHAAVVPGIAWAAESFPPRIFTRDNAPALDARRELPRVKSITQHGVTWTFESPAPAGRFVNGDWYVVGPVRVVAIDPKPLLGAEVPSAEISTRERKEVRDGRFIRNGSMLNPPARQEVALDSGIRNFFHPELLAQPPLSMKPGDSLVSSISLKPGEKSGFPYHDGGGRRDHHDDSPTRTVAVLTCLGDVQPEDAFRPSYGDAERKIYLARNLKREVLPRLKPTGDVPSWETWIRIYDRPWFNPCFFGWEQPMENMPHYGQWVGQAASMSGLMLLLDVDPKRREALLIRVVQVGIDYWGLVRNGHPGWQGFGGHGSGRKFPIVFAGLLLGDEVMASPTVAYPKVEFGEDNQTIYGKGWTGATALFAGHSGIQRKSGKVERPRWGPYEHLPPSQWTQGNYNSESYRRANTSSSWVGQALVLRLLKAEKAWAHDAFFDYVDRWMTEEDRENRRVIAKTWPDAAMAEKSSWSHQGNTWEPFVKSMWTRYRGPIVPLNTGAATGP